MSFITAITELSPAHADPSPAARDFMLKNVSVLVIRASTGTAPSGVLPTVLLPSLDLAACRASDFGLKESAFGARLVGRVYREEKLSFNDRVAARTVQESQ